MPSDRNSFHRIDCLFCCSECSASLVCVECSSLKIFNFSSNVEKSEESCDANNVCQKRSVPSDGMKVFSIRQSLLEHVPSYADENRDEEGVGDRVGAGVGEDVVSKREVRLVPPRATLSTSSALSNPLTE